MKFLATHLAFPRLIQRTADRTRAAVETLRIAEIGNACVGPGVPLFGTLVAKVLDLLIAINDLANVMGCLGLKTPGAGVSFSAQLS